MKTDKNREMFCFTLFFHLLFLFLKVIIEVYLINPSQYNAPFNLLSVIFLLKCGAMILQVLQAAVVGWKQKKCFADLNVMGFVWLAVSEYCWI